MADLIGCIADSRMKFHKDVHAGTYYPLSVYAAQGYNVDDIEKNCTDVEENPVVGKTYRVVLHSISEGQVRETVRKQLMDLKVDGVKGLKRKRKALAAVEPAKSSAVETAKSSGSKKSRKKAKRDRSSSSYSSSSSSSSSSKKTSSSSMPPPPKLSKTELKAFREEAKQKRQRKWKSDEESQPAASGVYRHKRIDCRKSNFDTVLLEF